MGSCLSSPVADEGASRPKGGVHQTHPQAPNLPKPDPEPAETEQENAIRQRQMHKRIAVAAQAITSASDVAIPNIPKTESARLLIEQAMKGNLLFDGLSLAARQAIVGSMSALSLPAGDTLISQGDTDATKYYVVERGALDVYVHKEEWGEERKVFTCTAGKGVGELALLYSAPRAASVRVAEACKLWVMEREVYNAVKLAHTKQLAVAKREVVDKVPMLAILAPEHKQAVSEALEIVEHAHGDVIFRQGDLGDRFYTVKEGTVTVTKDGREVARLSDGAYFGEQALIKDEPRGASVTADGYVVCFALSRKAFNDLLGPIEDVWRYDALRKVPILANLSEKQLFALARCMKPENYTAGQGVFRLGDVGDAFYVVDEGTFVVTSASGTELARCTKGQCFGELALLNHAPRAATVAAATNARVFKCTRDNFDAHLGTLAEIQNMWRFEMLRKVPLLAGLTSAQRLTLCTAFKPQRYAPGAPVFSKGDAGDAFYVVEKGTCVVKGDGGKELARLGPSSYFGEMALLKQEPRSATVIAETDVALLVLGRKEFTDLLGGVHEALRVQAAAYDATIKITKPLKPEDFKQLALLGSGAFGRVTLVKYEGRCYALKALSKGHVVQSGLQEHIKREKELQAEFANPFLVNLVASFKDRHSLYMVLELVQGGEFFTYLQSKDGGLPEASARFYAGCVVLGLEYMHDRSAAWRDLKPENLLLDNAGYLKLTDFGFAKKIPTGSKSYTLCGTPEYLAPELVTQSGHTRAVDWWAVGVLIFEMVAGFPPFNQEDRVAMFRAICAVQFRMPEHFSAPLKDLIRKLLVRVPNRRLGCSHGGIAEVKHHPWFEGFDWDALAARKMKAPHVPKVSSPEDASNFDGAGAGAPRGNSSYMSTGVFKDF